MQNGKGVGMMQVDPPGDCSQAWDWKANIAYGIMKLKQKLAVAKSHLKKYQHTPQQLLIETLALYNGGYYYQKDITGYDEYGKRILGWVRRNIICNGCDPNNANSGYDMDNDGDCIITGVCYYDNGCR